MEQDAAGGHGGKAKIVCSTAYNLDRICTQVTNGDPAPFFQGFEAKQIY